MLGKRKVWFKVSMEESPIVFENWFETPPQMVRYHVPIFPNDVEKTLTEEEESNENEKKSEAQS